MLDYAKNSRHLDFRHQGQLIHGITEKTITSVDKQPHVLAALTKDLIFESTELQSPLERAGEFVKFDTRV